MLPFKKFDGDIPADRWIIPCDAAMGEPLTGAARTDEYSRLRGLDDSYEGVDGEKIGGAGDDVFCGWKLGKEVHKVTVTVSNPSGGTAFANLLYAGEGDAVEVVGEPKEGFMIGGVQCTPSTVAVHGSTVTMPGEELRITVEFKPLTAQQKYLVNSKPCSGVDLKEAVAASGLALGKVEKIEAEGHITTADWEWLREKATDLSSLTAFEAASADDIPNGTTAIVPHLQRISITKGASSIGECAFMGAVELGMVEIPDVETLSRKAFQGCTKLSALEFRKLKIVEERAFEKLSLEVLNALELVAVGEGAFAGLG